MFEGRHLGRHERVWLIGAVGVMERSETSARGQYLALSHGSTNCLTLLASPKVSLKLSGRQFLELLETGQPVPVGSAALLVHITIDYKAGTCRTWSP